ncbi:nucleotidyl transferase [Psychromonas sp. psych-6C06]|uniref:nucleotidyltransferase family protein n=1 Tax=Psychromonas sp. psych-6C06 TaxID=2058089 RepID=UPI000C3426C4|nr:nucleotidyltransferase family protein [Psychromonas sp. psych-6C06]PKF62898.1 nucleotidyl transferase [Psychromonas sp. psych-6C06]
MRNTFILTEQSTLYDAIKALDETGIGFLAFIDQQKHLLGILTDGDLRRGILNKKTEIIDIINKDPVTIDYNTPQKEIIAHLKKLHRRHMPLIDNGIFKGVFSLDAIDFVSKQNVVVIMAGGLGSRLGALTKDTPKPMLQVGDRPMLRHLVEQFRDQDFRRFIFCLNYKKEVIKEYFGNGNKFGVQIDYIIEEKRMGTAGALSLIEQTIESPFFVINGDVLTDVDVNALLSFHQSKNNIATMCVQPYELQVPFGVVVTDEKSQIVDLKEKPVSTYNINAGIYVLNPEALNAIPRNQFYDMPTLFQHFIDKGKQCSVFNLHDYWLDIGQKSDLHQANQDMNNYKVSE